MVVQGRSWLLVHFGENSGLAGVELPDPESLASIVQNAANLPVPTVRPGMTAGLDLRITGPGKDRDAYLNDVREALAARLKKGGLSVDEKPEVVLQITTADGNEVKYGEVLGGRFIPGLGPSLANSFSVRALRCTLAWTDAQGRTLWKHEEDVAPSNVQQHNADRVAAVREEMWVMAKRVLSGGNLPLVVFPSATPGDPNDIPVLGEATMNESGELEVSK